MANSPPGEIEDLTFCNYCKQPFNETDQQPKLLACKHHFCLKCVNTVLLKGKELYCVHCWKCTQLSDMRPDSLPTHHSILALARRLTVGAGLSTPRPEISQFKPENCQTHTMPYTLWCLTCNLQICRGCVGSSDHSVHVIKTVVEAQQILRSDLQFELSHVQKLISHMNHLAFKQRDFMVKILEACTTLKTQLETELVNHAPNIELSEAHENLLRARQNFINSEVQTPAEIHSTLMNLNTEKEKLLMKHHEMFLQSKLDDLICNAEILIDFNHVKQVLSNGQCQTQGTNGFTNPVLFLANYCMSQLYSKQLLLKQKQNNNQYHNVQNGNPSDYQVMAPTLAPTPNWAPVIVHNNIKVSQNYDQAFKPQCPSDQNVMPNFVMKQNTPNYDGTLHSPNMKNNIMPFQTEAHAMALPTIVPPGPPLVQSSISSPQVMQSPIFQPNMLQHSQQPLLRNPSSHIYPVYYFNIEINNQPFGRILVEVRNDVAPKMAKNFSILVSGELGVGYKGCNIFQCWENESIITGDFETNNGRGGRSVFGETYFMPDDTKILAIRGSVGMRRSQKRHDNLGLVGSQFRIILREMRGFTGIFAYVAEGLELVDRISRTGDTAGKPQSNILIASCGRFM